MTLSSASGDSFSWRLNERAPAFVPQAIGIWIHVGIASEKPKVPGTSRRLHHCLQQRLISRRPPFRVPKRHGKDAHTSSVIHPCLGTSPFIPRDGRDRSFFHVDHLVHYSSCAQLRRRCPNDLCTFSYTSSRCSTQNHSTTYISLLLMACAFSFCSSFLPLPETSLCLLLQSNCSSPFP